MPTTYHISKILKSSRKKTYSANLNRTVDNINWYPWVNSFFEVEFLNMKYLHSKKFIAEMDKTENG